MYRLLISGFAAFLMFGYLAHLSLSGFDWLFAYQTAQVNAEDQEELQSPTDFTQVFTVLGYRSEILEAYDAPNEKVSEN